MGLNEGLSDRARAFSVANLLVRSVQDHKTSDGVLWNKGIGVELCAKELWEEFDRLGTEMLVTKAGRFVVYIGPRGVPCHTQQG